MPGADGINKHRVSFLETQHNSSFRPKKKASFEAFLLCGARIYSCLSPSSFLPFLGTISTESSDNVEERSATRRKAKKQKAKGDNPTVIKRLGEPLNDGVKERPIPLNCFLE